MKGTNVRFSRIGRRRRPAPRGMTLIEIIVVITIISLLMAAVAISVIPALDSARVDRAKMDIQTIQTALKTHYAKKGNYPDTGAGLKALVDTQILEKTPVDPWDHEYVYVLEAGKPVIMSYGADGAPGGVEKDADISSKDIGTAPKK
jgi:general secretion pathway protein G